MLTNEITWKTSQAKKDAMIEFKDETTMDLRTYLGKHAKGPWAAIKRPTDYLVRVEDPEDIRLMRKMFRPQDLGKFEMSVREKSARTNASCIATVVMGL